MAKDSSNSSYPRFKHVPTAAKDQDDLETDCDTIKGESDVDSDESDDHDSDSSAFTTPCVLDDLEHYDVASRPQEHQE
jgi:hypothetical protein